MKLKMRNIKKIKMLKSKLLVAFVLNDSFLLQQLVLRKVLFDWNVESIIILVIY